MRKTIFLMINLLAILACQVVPTPPPLRSTIKPFDVQRTSTPRQPANTIRPTLFHTATASQNEPATQVTHPPGELVEFPYRGGQRYAAVEKQVIDPAVRKSEWVIDLPVALEKIRNPGVMDGLSLKQQKLLASQGFLVIQAQDKQFSDIRQRTSWAHGQPYLLTADAANHVLVMTLEELLRALEREELHRRLESVVEAVFWQVVSYFPQLSGTELEAEARLAAAYLGVGWRLLDPSAILDPVVEPVVSSQIEQILSAGGVEDMLLFPGMREDFEVYEPIGHYKGDPILEAYYRGKTWLERIRFSAVASDRKTSSLYIPMILTLALRQSTTEMGPTALEWARIVETMNYFGGIRTGGGAAEFALLMDRAYGRGATILSLEDEPQLGIFRSLLRDLPLPQNNPTFPLGFSGEDGEKSWAFLGSRSRMDELILNILEEKQPPGLEPPFLLPGGLEFMAALGSARALKAMQYDGAEFRTDESDLLNLRADIRNLPRSVWEGSAHTLWLNAFRHRLDFSGLNADQKTEPVMPVPLWADKELNSVLGGWADLYIDGRGFAPEPDVSKAGSYEQAVSAFPPAPGYVEPAADFFYALSQIAFMTAEGLEQRRLSGVFSAHPKPLGLGALLQDLLDLADRLQRIGDIAVKELAGEPLNHSDYALIQAPLGPAEKRLANTQFSSDSQAPMRLTPLAGVAEIGAREERVLQIALGDLDRLYMLVPLDDGIHIAQGGVYSYYEFSLFRSRKMDNDSWQVLLANNPPDRAGWIKRELLMEGTPIDVLAYRIGDFYRVLPAAGLLEMRISPSRDARVIQIAGPGELLQIVGGPVTANGMIWWEFSLDHGSNGLDKGWIAENKDWFERAWYK